MKPDLSEIKELRDRIDYLERQIDYERDRHRREMREMYERHELDTHALRKQVELLSKMLVDRESLKVPRYIVFPEKTDPMPNPDPIRGWMAT